MIDILASNRAVLNNSVRLDKLLIIFVPPKGRPGPVVGAPQSLVVGPAFSRHAFRAVKAPVNLDARSLKLPG
jgi:hypothetical protein